jgi:3-hydroxybutyryl-CoA dehydrogenase
VRQPNSKLEAIAAARAVFEEAGFTVVVCADQAGACRSRGAAEI